MILMWSCPGNMPKYYPGLRDILPSPSGRVLCLSDLGKGRVICLSTWVIFWHITWTRPQYYIIKSKDWLAQNHDNK